MARTRERGRVYTTDKNLNSVKGECLIPRFVLTPGGVGGGEVLNTPQAFNLNNPQSSALLR